MIFCKECVKLKPMDQIDWESQWALFAPNFYDGLSHILLANGSTLLLKPGGGFGDLSHPTTRLVLSLMAPRVKNQTVIDIGCGSGILSIAAVLLGAKEAIGIDIDPEAIRHAQENASLNHVEQKIHFAKSFDDLPPGPYVIVINMIFNEQKNAWGSNQILHHCPATIITSGILHSQKASYLKQTQQWSWQLKEAHAEEEWCAFIF